MTPLTNFIFSLNKIYFRHQSVCVRIPIYDYEQAVSPKRTEPEVLKSWQTTKT